MNIFKSSSGLNTIVDPVRVQFNPDTGIQDLTAAVNVNIDNTGRIGRRKGTIKKLVGNYHSLFPAYEGYYLCVDKTAGNLIAVDANDYAPVVVTSINADAKVSYAALGDTVYYCNGIENGYAIGKISYSWVAGSYVGPTTTKTFSDPPIGHLLTLFAGRIWVSQDNILWYSEPFSYNSFNTSKNFIPFNTKHRMLEHVESGIVLSTENNIYFLRGTNPEEFQLEIFAEYPAIKGTAQKIPSHALQGIVDNVTLIFATEEGICACTKEGRFYNLSSEKITYPYVIKGAGLYKEGKYICTLAP